MTNTRRGLLLTTTLALLIGGGGLGIAQNGEPRSAVAQTQSAIKPPPPSPAPAAPLSAEEKAAYETLRTQVKYFGNGRCGRGGGDLAGRNCAARFAFAEGRGVPFAKIADRSTAEGKLYALLGLWTQTDYKTFAATAAPFQSCQNQVLLMNGCMGSEVPMATVVNNIQRGRFPLRLEKPTPTAKAVGVK